MIPYPDFERAIARWKARKEGRAGDWGMPDDKTPGPVVEAVVYGEYGAELVDPRDGAAMNVADEDIRREDEEI